MYSVTHAAAINLELCFAGAASSNSTHQSRHLDSRAGKAREHILQLRKLNLNLSFAALRTLGEDVEYKLGAINDFQVGRFIDHANLGRRQVLIEDDDVGAQLQ